MWRWIILFLLLPVIGYADTGDSTAAQLASSICQMLNRDTTVTANLTRANALEYARMAFDKAGTDFGKDTTRRVVRAAGAFGIKVDTALVAVAAVGYESSGYVVRFLRPAPIESLRVVQFETDVTRLKHGTHYAVVGDSIFVVPVTLATDSLKVIYWKRCKHQADSTTGTDLPQEYRDMALMYGCYLISKHLNNGRDKSFLEDYMLFRNEEWLRRGLLVGK